MKATRTDIKNPEVFQSFTLSLEVTTADEARALYAIFNIVANTRLLTRAHEIKDVIGREHYVTGTDSVIAKGVTYREFYK